MASRGHGTRPSRSSWSRSAEERSRNGRDAARKAPTASSSGRTVGVSPAPSTASRGKPSTRTRTSSTGPPIPSPSATRRRESGELADGAVGGLLRSLAGAVVPEAIAVHHQAGGDLGAVGLVLAEGGEGERLSGGPGERLSGRSLAGAEPESS